MKEGIHPNYREVVFQDMSSDFKFITRSTIQTKEMITLDGKEYPLAKIEVSSESHPFWADARQHGLNHGWSHTIRDHTGIFGTFSLVRRATPITEDELAASEPEMIWLSQRAHASIGTLMAEKVLPDAATRLKEVERQTLHWTAEGKTAAEVAAILEMTERNVNFHIRNAVTKLNAANKTHAVVKAALLGLIPATL